MSVVELQELEEIKNLLAKGQQVGVLTFAEIATAVAELDLDEAVAAVVAAARPAAGRTTCAEVLHGARTKKIERNSYDGLPAYGTSSQMRRADILARVDELIAEGRLETTGGPYPVLRVAV